MPERTSPRARNHPDIVDPGAGSPLHPPHNPGCGPHPHRAILTKVMAASSEHPPDTVPGPLAPGEVQQGYKACSKCKEVKLAATSFWRDPTKKGGYTSWCKQCFNKSSQRRKEQGPEVTVTERECSICKLRKPADAFMKDARRITGLDARCRECRRAQHAARKQRNIENGNTVWEEKECKRCHIVKPAAMFKRHAYTISGLDSWCKQCCSERRKELLAQKAMQHVGDPAAENNKECSQCLRIKPLTDFSKDKHQPSGHSKRCKACEKGAKGQQRKVKQEEEEHYTEDSETEEFSAGVPSASQRVTRSKAAAGTSTVAPAAPGAAAQGPDAMYGAAFLFTGMDQAQAAALLQAMGLPPGAYQAGAAAAGLIPPPPQLQLNLQPVADITQPTGTDAGLVFPGVPEAAPTPSLRAFMPDSFTGAPSPQPSPAGEPRAGSGPNSKGWGVVSTEGGTSFTNQPPLSNDAAAAGWGAPAAAPAAGVPGAIQLQAQPVQRRPTGRVSPFAANRSSAFTKGVDSELFEEFMRQDSVVLPPGMQAQLATDAVRGESLLLGLPKGQTLESLLLSQAASIPAAEAQPGTAATATPARPIQPLAGGGRQLSVRMESNAATERAVSLRDVADATRADTLFGLHPTMQGRIESLIGSAMRVDSPYFVTGSSPSRWDSVLRPGAANDTDLFVPSAPTATTSAQQQQPAAGQPGALVPVKPDPEGLLGNQGSLDLGGFSALSSLDQGPSAVGCLGEGFAGFHDPVRMVSLMSADGMDFAVALKSRQDSDVSLVDASALFGQPLQDGVVAAAAMGAGSGGSPGAGCPRSGEQQQDAQAAQQ